MALARAKEQVRECFELERSEAKQVRKCEREQKVAEEREYSRRWMEGVAKKKKLNKKSGNIMRRSSEGLSCLGK